MNLLLSSVWLLTILGGCIMTLSFSEYDKMIETFRSYNTPVFLPSLDEIAMFERDPERWLRFAIYLSKFGPAPKTDTEHYQSQLLTQFLYSNLSMVDDADSSTEGGDFDDWHLN